MGTPAKVVRTRNSFVDNKVNAMLYYRNAICYARSEHRGWEGADYEKQMRAWREEIERDFKGSGE
jgi:hypothetical protein